MHPGFIPVPLNGYTTRVTFVQCSIDYLADKIIAIAVVGLAAYIIFNINSRAMEKARAGNAGRGFAVVADEISKLADQTDTSIKEIDRLIKVNIEEIGRGMKNIEESGSTILNIIEGVTTIVAEINEVSQHIGTQNDISKTVNERAAAVMVMTDEIKISMNEQKNAMNEIITSIITMNDIIPTYSGGAQKLSDNAGDMEHMVGTLHNLAKSATA